jgi:hypothetical protein
VVISGHDIHFLDLVDFDRNKELTVGYIEAIFTLQGVVINGFIPLSPAIG